MRSEQSVGVFVRKHDGRAEARLAFGAALVMAVANGCGSDDLGALFAPARGRDAGLPSAGGGVAGAAMAAAGGGSPAASGGEGGASPQTKIDASVPRTDAGDAATRGASGGHAGQGAASSMSGGAASGGANPGGGVTSSGGSSSSGDAATTPDSGVAPEPDAGGGACRLEGTWASIVHIPVTWPASPLVLDAGTGEVVEWNLTERKKTGPASYRDTTWHCGILLPDLTGSVLANFQKYGIRFPNAVFDAKQVPPAVYDSTTSVVGSSVVWEAGPVVLLTGLNLTNPATAAWPASFSAAQAPDEDHDGLPGVTVVSVDPSTDPTYNWPPVGLPARWGLDYPRAARIGVVVRTVAELAGSVLTCDTLQAAVHVTTIAGTPALNSKVVGCKTTTGAACDATQTQFLNGERPQFTPSGAGTHVSVRIPDGAGCPDVRAKFPQ
jgi:hypothetical protein